MDERLKALKLLQQLICVAAAAVLAFAVTTDRSKDYRAALDELEVYRKVDLNNYPVYVKRHFARQEGTNSALLLKAAKQAHLTVRSSVVLSEPFIMDAPPLGAYIRLRDFEDFVTAQHTVGVYLVNDEPEVLARLTEQLRQKAPQPVLAPQPVPAPQSVPLTVTGIYASLGGSTSTIKGVPIADPVVLRQSPNVESVQFVLFNGLPMPPAANFSVSCTFKPSDNLHLALDWLKSDENGKKLIDQNLVLSFPDSSLFGNELRIWEQKTRPSFCKSASRRLDVEPSIFLGCQWIAILSFWQGQRPSLH